MTPQQMAHRVLEANMAGDARHEEFITRLAERTGLSAGECAQRVFMITMGVG